MCIRDSRYVNVGGFLSSRNLDDHGLGYFIGSWMESLRVVNVALVGGSIFGEAIGYSHLYNISTRRHTRNTIESFVISHMVTWLGRIERTRVRVCASKNQLLSLIHI